MLNRVWLTDFFENAAESVIFKKRVVINFPN